MKKKELKVFIDPEAIMYLLGTEMDYKQEEFSSQFIFKNPNETERCGCGSPLKLNRYNTFRTQSDEEYVQSYIFLGISILCKRLFDRQ